MNFGSIINLMLNFNFNIKYEPQMHMYLVGNIQLAMFDERSETCETFLNENETTRDMNTLSR